MALAVLPGGAFADTWCDDLWLARNALFAQAGQCFGTPLGRATFGEDCTGAASLDDRQKRAVEMIRRQEAALDCDVDTSRAAPLDVDHLTLRLRMPDQPIRDFESACIGWQGRAVTLRHGARADAVAVIEIPPGSDIGSYHASPYAGWHFLTVTLPTGLTAAGWTDRDVFAEGTCEMFAG